MSRVQYFLYVEVDDEEIFRGIYTNSTSLVEDIYKAERQVEKALEEEEIEK